MTERDWSKVDHYTPDPGAVVEVKDTGGVFCGNDARPFVPKSVRAKQRAAKAWKRYLRIGRKGEK